MKRFVKIISSGRVVRTLFIIAGLSFVAFDYGSKLKLSQSQVAIVEGEDDDEPLSTGCGGVERWDVKVMTDTAAYRLVLIPNHTSIFNLVTLATPTPSSSMPRYNPIEDSVYTVICSVVEKRDESDSDYHLVITDGANRMIAEVPDPNCNSVAASPYINDFIVARKWVDSVIGTGTYTSINVKNVEITGQAFIDPPHGQSGAAPNNLELHSIIKIRFYKPAGINTIASSEGLKIYPNPGNGLYNISMPAAHGNEKVKVYTMLGEEIFQTSITSTKTQINIVDRPQGVYLFVIESEDGGFISSGKLLLQ